MAWLSLAPTLWQIAREILAATIFGVDISVNCLMAQPMSGSGFDLQSASNLLGRPARHQPINHSIA